MSLDTKKIQKEFKRTRNYFEQENIGYVLSCAQINEERPIELRSTNLENRNAIVMLGNTLCDVVEKSFCEEDSYAFCASLTKSIARLLSTPTKEQLQQLVKNQLGGEV